ncbi:MAG: hypothetical protein ACD_79C00256G0004 [uncultured bacterium]|nr:MAG: hypothetical protein ACD_79C00256G0004 [uncultured bacterium]
MLKKSCFTNANGITILPMENPIIDAYYQAGLLGKAIILVLLVQSIHIWTIIQSKYFLLKKIRKKTSIFFDEFKKSNENIFQPIEKESYFKELPCYKIYLCAKNELMFVMNEERGVDLNDVEAISYKIEQIISSERAEFEQGDVQLATATTIAPFIGLLGTVWGIMNAFIGMGKMGNASIAAVAPGISESLVTTAMGLLVAIPAAVAYNFSKSETKKELETMNNFALEVLGGMEKKFVTRENNHK